MTPFSISRVASLVVRLRALLGAASVLLGSSCSPETFHGVRDARVDTNMANDRRDAGVGEGIDPDADVDTGSGGDGNGDVSDGGTDAGVDKPPPLCGHGCAVLSVPPTGTNAGTLFTLPFATAVDMTGASATFRVCLAGGKSGRIQTFSQEGAAPYSGHFDTWDFTVLYPCPTFRDVPFTFEVTGWAYMRAASVGVKIETNVDDAGMADGAVVYVDSITISRPDGAASIGPWNFDRDPNPFIVNTGAPFIQGSSVNWVE